MLPRNHPRPHPCLFRRPPPGGQCRAAPSGHPRPAPGPAGTRRPSPRPGRRAGAGQHGGQDADAGRFPRWRAATASTTPMRCAPVGRSVFSAAWSRRHPPWAPSCAASAGATSVNWTGVSRELLARAWQAGAGPGDSPLTIDLDSTICETYGLAKEGARHTAIPASGAITRCWPSPPAPARC